MRMLRILLGLQSASTIRQSLSSSKATLKRLLNFQWSRCLSLNRHFSGWSIILPTCRSLWRMMPSSANRCSPFWLHTSTSEWAMKPNINMTRRWKCTSKDMKSPQSTLTKGLYSQKSLSSNCTSFRGGIYKSSKNRNKHKWRCHLCSKIPHSLKRISRLSNWSNGSSSSKLNKKRRRPKLRLLLLKLPKQQPLRRQRKMR